MAIEDARFYEHNGVDLRGTVRALVANTQAGGVTQGGSTLTQQYVKNVLLSHGQDQGGARGRRRRLRQPQDARDAARAGAGEGWTKQQILEGYLNIAYFGRRRTASRRRRSGTSPARRRAEPRRPPRWPASSSTRRSTTRCSNPRTSQDRRNVVLQRMADLSMITQEVADKFAAKPLADQLDPSELTRGCAVSKVPFFCTTYSVRS